MKFPRLGSWLIGCLLCGMGGYWFGHPRQGSGDHAADEAGTAMKAGKFPHNRNYRQSEQGTEGLFTPELRDLLGNKPLSDASIRQVTMRVLEENDPVRRATAMGLILNSMTPTNAVAIRQAFIDITAETGRIHETEWPLMVRKFGQTLGPAALDEIKNNPGETALALEGWAMGDPNGALKHLHQMDRSDPEYANQCMAMLAGVAKTNPEKSFTLALTESDLPINPQALVHNAIQSAGMDGVTQALQNAIDHAETDSARKPNFNAIFKTLAESMIFQNWTSGKSENVMPWLEQQKGQPFLTNDVAIHAAKDVALQGKMIVALDWLDRINEGNEAGRLGRGGICDAVLNDPSLLAKLDLATLDRVIKQFPPKSKTMELLANALEPINPQNAQRLRNAGQ